MQSAHERKFNYRRQGIVGKWDVYQITLAGAEEVVNPFRDVQLRVAFSAPSGRVTTVFGFYDGENTWKARFCPDEVGEYHWEARLEAPGSAVEREGSFLCVPSENAGPLRPHPENPHCLADGRGQTVYLFGVRNFHPAEPWYIDGLKHERPGDDWSDLDAINYADTRISTYSTEDFLQDLADHGMNYLAMDTHHFGRFPAPHNTLWLRSGFKPDGMGNYNIRDRYNLTFAKRLDEIVRHAGRLGIYVRLIPICGCVFWEHHPLAAVNGGPVVDRSRIFDTPEVYPILDDYYRYIINRWAAFANVHWEVGNEIWNFNRETYTAFNERMVKFFHEHDPYRRLVTADVSGDILSFHVGHQDPQQVPALRPVDDQRGMNRTFSRRLVKTGLMWYPAGDEYSVDAVVYERTLKYYQEYPRFIHLDEFLLRGRNYQRIGVWAAFAAGGSVSSMDHPKYDIHIDPAVMDDHLHFSRFVSQLDLAKMAPRQDIVQSYDRGKLRAYCLASSDQVVVYLHHFADHARPCVDELVSLKLAPGKHTVRHYDPKSGRYYPDEVAADGGDLAVAIPEFTVDHVVYVARREW